MTEEKSWLEQTIDKLHAEIPESAWDEVAYRQWLAEMYRALDFLMKFGAWDAIYSFMIMDCLGENPEQGIAVLRFTSPIKHKLVPATALLLGRVRRALMKQGKDPDKALRGLEDGDGTPV